MESMSIFYLEQVRWIAKNKVVWRQRDGRGECTHEVCHTPSEKYSGRGVLNRPHAILDLLPSHRCVRLLTHAHLKVMREHQSYVEHTAAHSTLVSLRDVIHSIIILLEIKPDHFKPTLCGQSKMRKEKATFQEDGKKKNMKKAIEDVVSKKMGVNEASPTYAILTRIE
ncbi:unnamed protein product [Spodoptera exigua]|nr:unnamed protein product [Spodoptera exigua]